MVACRGYVGPGSPKKGATGSSFPACAGDPKLAPRTVTVSQMAAESGVNPRTIRRAKVSEQAGLGEEVRGGRPSPRGAADQVRGRSGKTSPKVNIKWRGDEEVGTHEDELAELRAHCRGRLTREIN